MDLKPPKPTWVENAGVVVFTITLFTTMLFYLALWISLLTVVIFSMTEKRRKNGNNKSSLL